MLKNGGEARISHKDRQLRLVLAAASVSAVLVCGLWGCATTQQQEPAQDASSDAGIQAMTEEQWAAYEPVVETLEDGRQIQKSPYAAGGGGTSSGYGFPLEWPYYNTYILNSDQRGCNSCHDLKTVMQTRMGDGNHPEYLARYGSEELPWSSCVACHFAYDVNIKNAVHAHMNSESFQNMNGSCLSCHDVDAEGNYQLWDEVKYNVLMGITDLDASAVDATVTWDQDEITSPEHQFVVEEPTKGFSAFDVVAESDDVRDTYTVSFGGEVKNPTTMTIQEMIDKYGTETRVQANHCTINGTGGGLIYQAEVTGIPLNKIVADLGLTDAAAAVTPIGVDGYSVQFRTTVLEKLNPLLVFEMNGEPLTKEQGYPLAIWTGDGTAGGMFTRYISEINFDTEDNLLKYMGNNYGDGVYGSYSNKRTGALVNTPNIGVLTAEDGQIFESGQPIHVEGYAHAFDKTVTKIELSFDRGATWKEVPIQNSDHTRWVYWDLDMNGLEPGAYVVTMRATGIGADGEEFINEVPPQFMFNVR